MNPCSCNLDTCRLCWLAKNDERYQKLWAKRNGSPAKAVATSGPGTELKQLLAELGFRAKPDCGCEAKWRRMNEWGVGGCRANLDTILGWLTEAKNQAGWLETIRGAALAVTSGLQIDPLDVEGSLVRIAIERASNR